jgi:hypothetical protein
MIRLLVSLPPVRFVVRQVRYWRMGRDFHHAATLLTGSRDETGWL